MNLMFLPLAATSSATATKSSTTVESYIFTFGTLIVVFGIFYFFLVRPQRKKDKEAQKMRNQLEVGDEVTTVGGIIGRVVSVKDDIVVIETGADRSKVRLRRWAIHSVDNVHDRAE